jgi:hypothetical protein
MSELQIVSAPACRSGFYDFLMNAFEPETETTYDVSQSKQYNADLKLTQCFREILAERTAHRQREITLRQEAAWQSYYQAT